MWRRAAIVAPRPRKKKKKSMPVPLVFGWGCVADEMYLPQSYLQYAGISSAAGADTQEKWGNGKRCAAHMIVPACYIFIFQYIRAFYL
jgi:hypothetical protein